MRTDRWARMGALVTTAALGLALLTPGTAGAAPTHARTSAKERHRVDTVPTPRLGWTSCHGTFQCADASLPLDYDHPRGAKTTVALLKSPARVSTQKVGTLFINPGGPGLSGTEIALYASDIFGSDVLDHFDIVGFDPRGVGSSDNVRCFRSAAQQAPVVDTIESISFPDSAKTAAAYIAATRTLGRACATTGRPLSVSMSAAEVARDLDVLRRAVGDKQLTYLGWSYGTYIGQVYANLFPDRIRAMTLDGVIDPVAWEGSKRTHNRPTWDRMHSAEGSARALHEILARCDRVGSGRCAFAAGDPFANFDLIARRLKAHPVPLDDGNGGTYVYGYDDFIGNVLDYLYYPDGADYIVPTLVNLWELTDPAAEHTAAGRTASDEAATRLTASRRSLAERIAGRRAATPGYENGIDAFASVSCTDSRNPDTIEQLPFYARRADRRVKYFGALWAWNTPMCARNAFTARDEDAYRGRFTHRTHTPVLFVGNTYDPATNVHAAIKAADLAPNSALILSDSWGHTAYGTSDCVTGAVDRYLLTGRPAGRLIRCRGDYQPFSSTGPSTSTSISAQARAGLASAGGRGPQ